MTEQEIQTKVEYVFSNSFNHTTHAYIDITGDLVAGTLLSQIMYWFAPSKNKTQKTRIFKDGYYWIAKRREDWWDEIRITPKQFDTAIKKLENGGKNKSGLNLVEIKRYKFDGIPTIHIRPIYDNINPLINQYKENIRKEIEESELSKEEIPIFTNGENGNLPKGKMEIDKEVKSITENYNKDYNAEITNTDFNSKSLNSEFLQNSDLRKPKPNSKKASVSEMPQKAYDISVGLGYDVEVSENVRDFFEYYLETFKKKMGKTHPLLQDATIRKIVQAITSGYVDENGNEVFAVVSDYPDQRNAVDEYFSINFSGNVNYNMPHFACENVIINVQKHLGQLL
jgi:hypothetical protein